MREPTFEVVIGFKGVGKTFLTNQIIDSYVTNGDNGRKGRPALVFDVNNEFCDSNGYYGYKAIDFDVTEKDDYIRSEQIRNIKVAGKYRIVPYKKNGQPMTINELMKTASTIVQYYRNGLLLLEDFNKYALSNFKTDFVGMFIGLRHMGVDLIAHFQSLRAIPPKVWSEMGYLRWHKQSEKIYKYRNRVSNLELFLLAEEIVDYKYQTDRRYHLWVSTMENRLINVTQDDMRQGCIRYLSNNPGEITKMMNHIDLEGVKKYNNTQQAINGFIEEKTALYLKS